MTYQNYNRLALERARVEGVPLTQAFEHSALEGRGIFRGKRIRKRISFTPYIHNACSADCLFCSEKLTRSGMPPAKMFQSSNYERRLRSILEDLRGVEIFLSISGMEPLESLPFLKRVLNVFSEYEDSGGLIGERVVYSNLSAVARNPERIADFLKGFKITRVESSRHHYDERVNQGIMLFKGQQPVERNADYETAIRALSPDLAPRLACVLQKTGTRTAVDVLAYIKWAATLGVRGVTFRELSILGGHTGKCATHDYISRNRVSIASVMETLSASFRLRGITRGYYYFSFHFQHDSMEDLRFEVADYEEMIRHHTSDTICKLVYYPTGDLCMDWNMAGKIEVQ